MKQASIVGNWDKFLATQRADQGNCPGEARASETGKAILARLRREVAVRGSADVAALPHDRLLLTLYPYGAIGMAVMDLPAELRDAELLTVMDADGLIQFGRRNHCHVGPVNASELRLEKGWKFRSVTSDTSMPFADWLNELSSEQANSPIRHHVSLTAKGRVEASRLTLSQRDPFAGKSAEIPKQPQAEADHNGSYMPADWFRDKFGIPSPRLRAARRDGRLDAIDVGTKRPRYQYSVRDAMRLWPDDGIYLPDVSG